MIIPMFLPPHVSGMTEGDIQYILLKATIISFVFVGVLIYLIEKAAHAMVYDGSWVWKFSPWIYMFLCILLFIISLPYLS